MVAQAGAAVGDAAIGELDVEGAERGGDVEDEEAMEGAYRRVSGQSVGRRVKGGWIRYLKAGRRPKKATNVSSETVTVKMAMARARGMAGHPLRLPQLRAALASSE
jgi:hypothetical protein